MKNISILKNHEYEKYYSKMLFFCHQQKNTEGMGVDSFKLENLGVGFDFHARIDNFSPTMFLTWKIFSATSEAIQIMLDTHGSRGELGGMGQCH